MEKKKLPKNSIRRSRRNQYVPIKFQGRALWRRQMIIQTRWRLIRMKHYIHSRNDQNSQKFLITESFYDKNDVYNFSTSSLSTVQVVQDEQKLDCPSSCKPTNVILFCSCDGLVLIFVSSRGLYDSSARLYEEILLWNPSTRESILLPHPKFRVVYCVCGLGYDSTSEDYKILAINLNAYHSFDTSIEVLSLKSGSWRRIGYPTGIEHVTGFRSCGMDYLAFLHGAFHWLAKLLTEDWKGAVADLKEAVEKYPQGPGPLQSMNTRPVVKVLYSWKAVCVRRLVKLQSTPPIRSDERRLVKSSPKSPGRPGRGFTPLSKEVSTLNCVEDLVPLIQVDAYIPSSGIRA
ncbi:hypothetical protein KY289_037827 [Solanum tuberosum]|nr:hypothetical protein KY289_037827 [Solanum tuberosum]